ncbi:MULTISPECIES: ATP-binding protein [unclassified Streptomyces]|uniref:ATP-binding protein n=1 Tax=unclassified Streptomyces TaxID=2593676 RepID=UPI00324BAAA9
MYSTTATAAPPRLSEESGSVSAPTWPPPPRPPDHSAVIALPADASRVRTARRFVTAHLIHWQVAQAEQDRAELIVSELAGNAARHGRTDMTIRISLVDRDLRIDVTDSGSPASSRSLLPAPSDEAGRGLRLVGLLADWTAIRPHMQGWRACAGLHCSA